MAALPCVLGTWKWANRLMEQWYCYISPFTVKKVKGCALRAIGGEWGVVMVVV